MRLAETRRGSTGTRRGLGGGSAGFGSVRRLVDKNRAAVTNALRLIYDRAERYFRQPTVRPCMDLADRPTNRPDRPAWPLTSRPTHGGRSRSRLAKRPAVPQDPPVGSFIAIQSPTPTQLIWTWAERLYLSSLGARPPARPLVRPPARPSARPPVRPLARPSACPAVRLPARPPARPSSHQPASSPNRPITRKNQLSGHPTPIAPTCPPIPPNCPQYSSA